MGTSTPEGMRRALRALREEQEPVAVAELARRLLALAAPPPPAMARRLVGELLGAEPAALPERLVPAVLRPAAEGEVAGDGLAEAAFAVVDVETTGLSPERDAVIEIGAVRVERGRVTSRFETLVRPPGPGPLSERIVALTGIGPELLGDAPPAHRALPAFRAWLDGAPGAPWVAHNARFDRGFLCRAFEGQGAAAPEVAVLCTQKLSRRLLPRLGRYDLDHLCAHFGIRNRARHRALGDAEATARAWIELLGVAAAEGHARVGDLLDLQERPTRRKKRRRAAVASSA